MNIDIELLKRAIEKNGHRKQMEMVEEESGELASAMHKYLTRGKTSELATNVIDEIADMNIMIAQANILFNPKLIQERIDYKLGRLKNRLEKGIK